MRNLSNDMRKLIINVLIVIAGILAFSSCDLDFKDTYTFENKYEFNFEDEDVQKSITEYIESVVPNAKLNPFFASQYDAMIYGIDAFKANAEAIDKDVILGLLPEAGDAAQYQIRMKGSYYDEAVGWLTWVKEGSSEE